MTPFITGSHAYGSPTKDSDIDLVIPPMTSMELKLLVAASDHGKFPISFGRLNLIVADSEDYFKCWEMCNNDLINKQLSLGRPITREEAVAYISQTFEVSGISLDEHPSS